MGGLKDYSLQNFKSKINKLWVSEVFVDCIKDVYESTSDVKCKMRGAVIDVVHQHLAELWQKKPFKELFREGGDFGVDLMSKMVSG